jgi:hypothetical protein
MTDEYWGTFSIYDHRGSIYRQSLVVFDRIVIPVPPKPVGNLTQQEIERLARDADWLKLELELRPHCLARRPCRSAERGLHHAADRDSTRGGQVFDFEYHYDDGDRPRLAKPPTGESSG